MGDRLQGLVPDRGWPTLRTTDAAGSGKSIPVVLPGIGFDANRVGPAGLGKRVSRIWVAGAHPQRQRSAVRQQWGMRTDGIERVVDRAGSGMRAHPAWPS